MGWLDLLSRFGLVVFILMMTSIIIHGEKNTFMVLSVIGALMYILLPLFKLKVSYNVL